MLLKYILFAFVSVAVNYSIFRACYDFLLKTVFLNAWITAAFEWLLLQLSITGLDVAENLHFWSSYGVGLFSGFVLKYLLDKKFVFNDGYENRKTETKKAGMYALMSLLCTVISIGITAFVKYTFGPERAKDIGWFLGLLIGYTLKFYLDKRYVFKQS